MFIPYLRSYYGMLDQCFHYNHVISVLLKFIFLEYLLWIICTLFLEYLHWMICTLLVSLWLVVCSALKTCTRNLGDMSIVAGADLGYFLGRGERWGSWPGPVPLVPPVHHRPCMIQSAYSPMWTASLFVCPHLSM